MSQTAKTAPFTPDITSTKGAGLTREVVQFVIDAKYEDIPAQVIALGKKSILDGLGLALAGSVQQTGLITQKYLHDLGITSGSTTLIGTRDKIPARFAAFANGI